MKRTKLTQLVAIVLVGLLVVGFYFSGKNSDTGTGGSDVTDKIELTEDASLSNWEYNIRQIEEDLLAADSLPQQLDSLYAEKVTDTTQWFRNLALAWGEMGHDLLSGYYYERLALKTGSADDWYSAGNNFFNLMSLVQDSFIRDQLLRHAVMGLERSIKANPDNLNAKVELGVCYLESPGRSPMEGIGLLKEVEMVDSTHEEALFYLGYFSMQTGQYDKSISRFETLVHAYPDKPVYYQYLGQAHLMNGEKEIAIQFFQEHAARLEDETQKAAALDAIERLKNQ